MEFKDSFLEESSTLSPSWSWRQMRGEELPFRTEYIQATRYLIFSCMASPDKFQVRGSKVFQWQSGHSHTYVEGHEQFRNLQF